MAHTVNATANSTDARPTVNYLTIVHALSKIMGEQGLFQYNMAKVVEKQQAQIKSLLPLSTNAAKGLVHMIHLSKTFDLLQVMGGVAIMAGAGGGMLAGGSGLLGGSMGAVPNGLFSAGMGAQGASSMAQAGITLRKGDLQGQIQQVSVATDLLNRVNTADMGTVKSSADTNGAIAKASSNTIYVTYISSNLRG